jgi:hypothetical protein
LLDTGITWRTIVNDTVRIHINLLLIAKARIYLD